MSGQTIRLRNHIKGKDLNPAEAFLPAKLEASRAERVVWLGLGRSFPFGDRPYIL